MECGENTATWSDDEFKTNKPLSVGKMFKVADKEFHCGLH